MRKKLLAILFFLSIFCLVACGRSINGTYIQRGDGIQRQLSISDNKTAKMKIKNFLFGTYYLKGTINQQKKEIHLKGEKWGASVDLEGTYDFTDKGNLVVTLEGETISFEREEK